MSKKRDRKKAVVAEPTPPMPKQMSKSTWKLMDRAATIGAGVLAQRATRVTWESLTGTKPPKSGRHPEVGTREAVLWAALAGALTEVVRTSVHRGVAGYWVRSTGDLPPGMKTLAADVPDEDPKPDVEAPEKDAKKARKQARKRKKE